jgi:hypothetical protein
MQNVEAIIFEPVGCLAEFPGRQATAGSSTRLGDKPSRMSWIATHSSAGKMARSIRRGL